MYIIIDPHTTEILAILWSLDIMNIFILTIATTKPNIIAPIAQTDKSNPELFINDGPIIYWEKNVMMAAWYTALKKFNQNTILLIFWIWNKKIK